MVRPAGTSPPKKKRQRMSKNVLQPNATGNPLYICHLLPALYHFRLESATSYILDRKSSGHLGVVPRQWHELQSLSVKYHEFRIGFVTCKETINNRTYLTGPVSCLINVNGEPMFVDRLNHPVPESHIIRFPELRGPHRLQREIEDRKNIMEESRERELVGFWADSTLYVLNRALWSARVVVALANTKAPLKRVAWEYPSCVAGLANKTPLNILWETLNGWLGELLAVRFEMGFNHRPADEWPEVERLRKEDPSKLASSQQKWASGIFLLLSLSVLYAATKRSTLPDEGMGKSSSDPWQSMPIVCFLVCRSASNKLFIGSRAGTRPPAVGKPAEQPATPGSHGGQGEKVADNHENVIRDMIVFEKPPLPDVRPPTVNADGHGQPGQAPGEDGFGGVGIGAGNTGKPISDHGTRFDSTDLESDSDDSYRTRGAKRVLKVARARAYLAKKEKQAAKRKASKTRGRRSSTTKIRNQRWPGLDPARFNEE
ncbi:MAG: hypothetical protein M1823_006060 [Watsoniomyces obsoletus]|nr:MAG: hypothetical protein M1823_006060 [Watsoniomyces obsoletus]